MLIFIVNNIILDLPPDLELEVESNNTFLQFDETIKGNFSLPFELSLASENNQRALKFQAQFQNTVDTDGFDCICIRNGIQHSTGKLKIEQSRPVIGDMARGVVNVFYLYGISDFYQAIKDIKLRTVDLGNELWETPNRTNQFYNSTTGFWANAQKIMRAEPGIYNYAIYPVINKSYKNGTNVCEVINICSEAGGTVSLAQTSTGFNASTPATHNPICYFPYLSKTLIAIQNKIGWRFSGAILNDADFNKITLINYFMIKYAAVGGRTVYYTQKKIAISVADSLPDVDISSFLIDIKNRMGWWFSFDFKNKIINIGSINDAVSGAIKDYSRYASPAIVKKIIQEPKTIALRTEYSNELANGAPDFSSVTQMPPVNTRAELPAPTDAQYRNIRLVKAENNFYICTISQANEDILEWRFYTYNIYDYFTSEQTEDIKTKAGIIGNERYNDYLDFVPRLDKDITFSGNDTIEPETSITLCFYHGHKNNKQNRKYPYASAFIYDSNGLQVANWALSYNCYRYDGKDVGLYPTFWKRLIDLMGDTEEIETTVYLPLLEYLKLSFTDTIIIHGVKMLIKKVTEKLPYKENVKLLCKRIS